MSEIIGHRGARGEQPENTILGIRHALKNKLDGVEIDVHLSKDRKLVVIHDSTLDRTTNGKGKVSDYNLKELRKLDAGKGEKIPILQEVIKLIKKTEKEIFIEIKCQNAEKQVADIIKKNKIYEKALVISFDHKIVKKIKEINPKITTGCLLAEQVVNVIRLLKEANANILAINYSFVNKKLIGECHKNNFRVLIWTVNDEENLEKFSDMGADYIATDFPSKFKR